MIQVLFRNYYRQAGLEVERPERREFAWQPFEGGMVRHRSFASADELRRLAAERPPRHLYHSVAYYRQPAAEDMEAKGLLGADLVFDIDGDHLETEACRAGGPLLSLACLEDAKEEANKLLDVLNAELGLKPSRIVFSGNRGFHVHVSDEEVLGLGQRERRELVNYLKAAGFQPESFRVELGGRRRRVLLYEEAADGNLLRIRKGVEDPSQLAVKVDEVVTQDLHRLIRLPGSLNGKTGLVALPLSVRDLEGPAEAIVDRAIAFRRGHLKVSFKAPLSGRALFERVEAREGDVRVLPAYLAVYLHLQGLADVAE